MNIRGQLYTKLNNDTEAESRVYGGGRAPQGTDTPYIVFFMVSNNRRYSLEGHANLTRTRIQVSCYGSSYQEASDLAEEVTELLEGWEGKYVVQDNKQDLYEEEAGVYHVPVDFFIGY